MAPDRQFHLFPQLPPELRELIWAFHEAAADLPSTRHLFAASGDGSGARTAPRLVLDKRAAAGDHAYLRYRRRVRLPGAVRAVDAQRAPYTAADEWSTLALARLLPPPPAGLDVWADLARDVFAFVQQAHPAAPPPAYLPHFRGAALPDAHWLFAVRRLALRPPPRPALAARVPPADAALLARMRRLAAVYLVVAEVPSGRDRNNVRQRAGRDPPPTPDALGFMPVDDFRAASSWPAGLAARDALGRFFADHGLSVDVQVVVDLY
ncbi:hypothetical protein GGS23DRAFT_613142 [Durotheca rogersii]|uniref:uncharacterized protein n=1 Tax=Durotheca rogersii TaxID=419775 RepID=UPI00221F7F8D|nr:uncharacterized protein GGS23DRAFT_613142 [Durotheca rogersii]KAI5861004.1 hypothetical protein GGS23DRAFT_613142 [Durotheca rogersii]